MAGGREVKRAHFLSSILFGLVLGLSVVVIHARVVGLDWADRGSGEFGVTDLLRAFLVVGAAVGGALLWNWYQYVRMSSEARSIMRMVEDMRRDGLVHWGWDGDFRWFEASGGRFVLKGWAFGGRTRFARPKLILRIGKRSIDPEWHERSDVGLVFGDRFDVPQRSGFDFRFQTGFGLKRIELCVVEGEAERVLERFWRFSLRRSRRRSDAFAGWFEKNGGCGDGDLEALKLRIQNLDTKPLISILLPVYNVEPALLEAAIRSVIAQVYPNWELCMVDDASTDEATREAVRQLSGLDSRIRVRYRSFNGHISEATNTALSYAGGAYVGLLDHDDELTPNALAEVALAIAKHPEAKWLYSDEDKVDPKGNLASPYFKPDYDPELLMRQNYICHFTVIERGLFQRIGGMRVGLEGSQDWDCFLRLSREVRPAEVIHIPKILYHWRMAPGSSAKTVGEKGYSVRAAERAIREHLEALGIEATVRPVGGMYWSVIPVRDGILDYANLNTGEPDFIEKLAMEMERGENRIWILVPDASVSRTINPGARDVLGRMLRTPWVGAVAPMVIGRDGELVHSGTYLDPRGAVWHPFKGQPRDVTGMGWRVQLAQTQSGLHAPVLAIRGSALRDVDLDEVLDGIAPYWRGLALTLALGESGWRSLYVPDAQVRVAMDWSDGGDEPVPEILRRRYSRWFDRDPCFNPNLGLAPGGFQPVGDPRNAEPAPGRDYGAGD